VNTEEPAIPRGTLASDTGGTPKRGYRCPRCLDWTTVTEVATVGDGATSVRSMPCPACQPPDGPAS
jgi:hypothetical protein